MTNTRAAQKAQKAPGRARGEYAKTRKTRKAIMEAALEVFSEGGYRAGSLREIAVRVGMSEAGLLHHFANKSALLEAVLDHRDDQARQLVPIESDDGAAVLRGLVRLAAYNASIPGVVELFCTLSAEATSPDHPAHAYFLRRYEYTRRNLSNAFASLAAEQRLAAGMTPERAAITLIAMMDGLQVQWLLDRDIVDMAEALQLLIAGFVDIDWEADEDSA